MQARRGRVGWLLLLVSWGAVLGCREEVPPLFRRNRAPETTLTIVAEESTAAFYRYHVYWRGEDPDGEVVRFLFAITDTVSLDEEENWDPGLAVDRERGVFTARNDSVFLFDSNLGRQAFNIVSIDDFGELDPSPARGFFRVVDNGLPRVAFFDIRAESPRPDVLPCVSTLPCTIPVYTNFSLRFGGTTNNGAIIGYTWRPSTGLWEPFYTTADTFYLRVNEIQGDTLGFDQQGRQRYTVSAGHDTVTVWSYSSREGPIPPGQLTFQARVLDQARRRSDLKGGERFITVNYDPDTRLFRIPECNCPNAPPGCTSSREVPVGWVTGISRVESFPLDEWRLFCPGDTIPNFSRVTLYARGWDDRRDIPLDPVAGLAEVDLRFRFEYGAQEFFSGNMPFSDPALVAADLPLPSNVGGGTFRGAAISWSTCPFDYRGEGGAVDENNKVDGTAAHVPFFVSGSPTLDSLRVPKVLVFLPRCPDLLAPLCPWLVTPPVFGPDTVAVLGIPIPDVSPPQTPLGLGFNDFDFPFVAWGHDHPRDRNHPGADYYEPSNEGRVRSWRFTYECTAPNCSDLALAGEGVWREDRKGGSDPPGQEVFDDLLRIRIVLDTLCLTAPCRIQSTRAVLKFDRFGPYEFTIQGRDTEFIGQTCIQPSDLGAAASFFPIPISELGRTTRVARQPIDWRQLYEVRTPRQAAPAAGVAVPPHAKHKRSMP